METFIDIDFIVSISGVYIFKCASKDNLEIYFQNLNRLTLWNHESDILDLAVKLLNNN